MSCKKGIIIIIIIITIITYLLAYPMMKESLWSLPVLT